jgi:hypothetical protein
LSGPGRPALREAGRPELAQAAWIQAVPAQRVPLEREPAAGLQPVGARSVQAFRPVQPVQIRFRTSPVLPASAGPAASGRA